MRTIIIDDEHLAVRVLEKYVKLNPLLQLTASFTDPLEAFAYLQQHEVDLILLDINMPELSGLALIRSLARPPKVIFTTAYPEYAVEGFEVEAVDYLVKPIAPGRFLKAVEKAHRTQNQPAHATEETRHLLVKADRKLYRLPLDELLYLQAYGDYVKIVCSDKVITPKEKLSNLEKMLPDQSFLRVHRSYIIALDKVEYMEGNLVFINRQSIPVAQANREQLLTKLA
ncbi:LytR/AlgR family response regulator transcription factor [Flavilitoribacter nigricans]|uniref:DNA-binding response regulator n=1 Tax=Flavilitoribacter nigricans (strain ATCC 23147 / DSM 23189 / NBRC 102662 / NCIMB 1420 / SS-2) TaxID=1122177 RepID=A0A2D0MZK1_FLAN2|nr:LytTR family DNA-binding domain-containing protein [Flavilitoribacter nigricans]PHN01319.1 DNA-binding response regulator [Flavilitoribacter nigricans DSM 23189 = NBRC 102662]